MMEFTVFSLFPEMFQGMLQESIIRRALDSGAVSVRVVNFREYATDKHRTVDDYPFGGGAGMLLKPGPLFAAVEDAKGRIDHTCDPTRPRKPHIVLMSPQGRRFTQEVAREFAGYSDVYLVCGHYEGFDERVRQHLVDDEVSIGDFVLTGGEIPAMAIMDAVIRLIPGVLGNHSSADDDSFSTGLLEYPQYTRPAEFRGWTVPAALLSGHHEQVAEWRKRHSLYRTWVRRPDLLSRLELSEQERRMLTRWDRRDFSDIDVLEKSDTLESEHDS